MKISPVVQALKNFLYCTRCTLPVLKARNLVTLSHFCKQKERTLGVCSWKRCVRGYSTIFVAGEFPAIFLVGIGFLLISGRL
jgi:hypothetical protein